MKLLSQTMCPLSSSHTGCPTKHGAAMMMKQSSCTNDLSSAKVLAMAATGTSHPFLLFKAWRERVWSAMQLYTLQGAKAMWLESQSGSLTVGKRADICIVASDIFSDETWVDAPTLEQHVVATFAAGKLIFDR